MNQAEPRYPFLGSRRYHLSKQLVVLFLRFFYRLRVEGLENLPNEGSAVLVSNHPTYLDPLVLHVISPRVIRFMAWDRLFQVPFLGRLIRSCGSFPVHRGRFDRQSFDKSLQLLRNGELLGLFPEGGRSKDPAHPRLMRGAARIATRMQVPVIPVRIERARAIWPPHQRFPRISGRIHVHLLPPLAPPHIQEELHAQLSLLIAPRIP